MVRDKKMFALIQKVSRNEKKPLALNLFSVTNITNISFKSLLKEELQVDFPMKRNHWLSASGGLECFTTALRDTSPTRSGSRHQGVHGMLSLEPSENKSIS